MWLEAIARDAAPFGSRHCPDSREAQAGPATSALRSTRPCLCTAVGVGQCLSGAWSGERRPLSGRHEDRVHQEAFSPDGRTLVTTADDGRVLVWDLRSGAVRETLTGQTGPITNIRISDDGRTLYTVGLHGRIYIWDIAADRRLGRGFQAHPLVPPPLSGLRAPAQAIAFSADGERFAVADLEGNLRMLELRSGRVRRAQRPGSFPVHLSFSPDGGTLAIGLGEAGTELRDGRSLRVLARLRNRRGDADRWVQFSPDGRLLAISSFGYTQLWDAESRRPVGAPLGGHEGDVFNAEFSPDGEMLATSGFDGSVILWDVDSRRTLGALPGSLGFTSARFTPDGRPLFKLFETGAAQRWEVSLDAWSRHACAVAGRELTRAEWQEFVPDQDYRRVCSV